MCYKDDYYTKNGKIYTSFSDSALKKAGFSLLYATSCKTKFANGYFTKSLRTWGKNDVCFLAVTTKSGKSNNLIVGGIENCRHIFKNPVTKSK